MVSPDYGFLEAVEAAGPFNVSACFQCRKCTSGCPATFAMDIPPDQVVRLVLLGARDEVLRSHTIWVCASCETCTTRCPNGVKIAELMDGLKEMALKSGIPSPEPTVTALHREFLTDIGRRGRVFEGGLIPRFVMASGKTWSMLSTGAWKEEASLGWKMFRRGRLALYPHGIKGKDEVRSILSGKEAAR